MDTSTWLCGPPPARGQRQRYPSRFVYNLKRTYLKPGMRVLSMFSGASDLGDTTDVRAETGAMFVAPYDELPDGMGPYDIVIADPPYNAGFGARWTGERAEATLPRPKRIAASAVKVLRPGGLFLLLHVIVLPAYKSLGLERAALHPILCGPNNAIRVLNVMRLREETLCR